MGKIIAIIVLLIIAIIAFYFYLSNQLPPGVEAKGNETMVAVISLCTAIVSLLGSVITFIFKILEIKAKKQKSD